jgi:hypothetical protein
LPEEKADRVNIIDPRCGEGLAIKQIAESLAIRMSNVYAVERRTEKATENLLGASDRVIPRVRRSLPHSNGFLAKKRL